eukprot:6975882-Ditylum_brightwellii.AAC.1
MTQYNNIEQNRVGGSGGLYKQPTKVLFEIMDFKNVSPRLGRSTVVILNRAMVNVVYMNAGGLPKCFASCISNFGVQVKLIPRDVFYDYKFFAPFTKCKIIVSLLLLELKCFDENMNVTPMAVKCDMKSLK